MKRLILNSIALALIFGGAGHLHAEVVPLVQACCSPTFGDAKCCGTTCQADLFSCSATK
ncbi:MAG: hypothetical protein JO040_06925 [Gemmatimonadetes bacterium]|nr:hypothetical protein [Gemmatimonadota bacterium]